MSTLYTNLVERSLDLAAGTKVNPDAYEAAGINLAKLQAVGKAFRTGWLHNVLQRITPITAREVDDYLLMADLFINSKAEAQHLLQGMSRDLSMFATAAGVTVAHNVIPFQLKPHTALYHTMAERLTTKYNFIAPQPFASTVFDAKAQAQIPFIRNFMKAHFKAA
jgi:hypothetical protein